MEQTKGRIELCTIGPVPVTGLVSIMQQLRDQEWRVCFVSFAGMIAVETFRETSVLRVTSLQRPVPVPSYVIIAEKLFYGEDKFDPPKIKMGGTL